jgi:ubiquinone/menaquinone biosynthesis C-methylase UbiE
MNWEKYWDEQALADHEMAVISKHFNSHKELFASGEASLSYLDKYWESITDRENCLDFGCGIGRVSVVLAKRFKQVVGIDISEEMLKIARRNALIAETRNIQFKKCNGENIQFINDDTFSFVFSIICLQHIEPPEVRDLMRKELVRVTKPGGWLFLQDIYPQQWREGMCEDYKKWDIDYIDIISEGDFSLSVWLRKKGFTVTSMPITGTPTISVIIPTYNQAKYIDETLKSIFNQTFKDFEIVIVNDGSTDNTKKILSEWEKSCTNIKVIHQSNKRLPGALNTGLKNVTGKYVTWMSSDCYYEPTAFEKMKNVLDNEKDIGMVCSAFKIFGNREQGMYHNFKTGIIHNWDMRKGNFVGNCFMFRKECVDKIGYFDEELECVEDWDYWIRISEHWKIRYIHEMLAYWREHGENMSNNRCFSLGPINKLKMFSKMEKRNATIAKSS